MSYARTCLHSLNARESVWRTLVQRVGALSVLTEWFIIHVLSSVRKVIWWSVTRRITKCHFYREFYICIRSTTVLTYREKCARARTFELFYVRDAKSGVVKSHTEVILHFISHLNSISASCCTGEIWGPKRSLKRPKFSLSAIKRLVAHGNMYLVQTRECTSPIQCHPRYCSVQSTLPARLRAIGSVSCSSNRNARGADVMVFDETFGEAMRTQTNVFFCFTTLWQELTLCVEGNIGVGKTTFLQSLLSEDSKVKVGHIHVLIQLLWRIWITGHISNSSRTRRPVAKSVWEGRFK